MFQSTTETVNAETSDSAALDDRGESELSSSRQSSLEDELSPMSAHEAVSEVSGRALVVE